MNNDDYSSSSELASSLLLSLSKISSWTARTCMTSGGLWSPGGGRICCCSRALGAGGNSTGIPGFHPDGTAIFGGSRFWIAERFIILSGGGGSMSASTFFSMFSTVLGRPMSRSELRSSHLLVLWRWRQRAAERCLPCTELRRSKRCVANLVSVG